MTYEKLCEIYGLMSLYKVTWGRCLWKRLFQPSSIDTWYLSVVR